ncbi:hypothetical protein [Beutenbergia cavernae]|uniref:hypothetical protein n=1 Tax=Beutenbergia cavernae TaxID=84757 RepID=UPI00019ACD74|nr:hypothetical protein [Beutenbergia cavernae]
MRIGVGAARAAVMAGVAALVAVGLVACNGGGGEEPTSTADVTETTTPSPSPSPSPTLDPREANIEQAKAALTEYVRLSNEVMNAGGEGWQDLSRWWGTPDLAERYTSTYLSMIEQGRHTEGSSSVSQILVTDYVEDPTGAGHEQIHFEYCSDTSDVTLLEASGDVVPQVGDDPRFIVSVLLQRQGEGSGWTLNTLESHPDRSC